jgi:transcriptional regulator with XRE-family HTH domain
MEKLAQYLKSNNVSAAHLAAQVGVTRQYIWALAKGTSLPRVDVAFRIEDATNGAVPARAWVTNPAAVR